MVTSATTLEVPVPHKAVASPTTSCGTGCIFGAEHVSHPCAGSSRSPSVSCEHIGAPPPGITSSSGGAYHSVDNEGSLADLISRYGNTSSLAWLDTERYQIWRPSQPIPESEFKPVQGYLQKEHYAFAWGNPLVSSPAALEKTARAFIAFAEANHLHPIWCCADQDLEAVLSSDAMGWATMSCIYEDVMDPAHVIELLDSKLEHHSPTTAHLKKRIAQAQQEHIETHEVKYGEWHPAERQAVEAGIKEWEAHRSAIEFVTMSINPWLDEEHRRYWIAVKDSKVVGVEILSRSSPTSWQIIKCIPFISFAPSTPGITENLIVTALKDLHAEEVARAEASPLMSVPEPEGKVDSSTQGNLSDNAVAQRPVAVSFGITAANHLHPGHNIGGWKVSVLSRTYKAVAGLAGLPKINTFRKQFEAKEEPMFICHPANRFGFLAVGPLLLALRM